MPNLPKKTRKANSAISAYVHHKQQVIADAEGLTKQAVISIIADLSNKDTSGDSGLFGSFETNYILCGSAEFVEKDRDGDNHIFGNFERYLYTVCYCRNYRK